MPFPQTYLIRILVKTKTHGAARHLSRSYICILKSFPFITAQNTVYSQTNKCQRMLPKSLPWALLENKGAGSYLFQDRRLLNFHSCDVEPRPFVLAKHKGMKQFVFIREAAFPQQEIPQLRCHGRIAPDPQRIAAGVFFYGGKMFTVRMPNSSKGVNRVVNQTCFPGI